MTLSTPGLIGLAIGLLLAAGTYVALSGHLKEKEAAGDAGASAIRTILPADIPVLAAVGYFVGQLFD